MSRRLIGLAIGVLLVAVTLTGAASATAGTPPEPSQQYRVDGPASKEQRTAVHRTGAAIDEVGDRYVVVTAPPASIRQLERLGYRVTALKPQPAPPAALLAAYHNYQEMVAELDKIVADHPTLATKASVGTTYQNRDIPVIKISDNAGTDEDEPEVLFTSSQHAREILTPEMALYLANLFTDSYGTDNQIKQLVDSREIWIVPMANPDGIVYDRESGSFRSWRKNRQPNSGSSAVGTDLNRNWPYKWACCGGSSSNPGAEDYHGPSAGSAPEIRALTSFVRSRVVGGEQQLKAHIDFHTYGELVMWPMGYTYNDTGPDLSQDARDTFATIGREMANSNGYTPQQSSDLYLTDGAIVDWMYADQGIFSYVFEMYPTGGNFYPPASVIDRETSRNKMAVTTLLGYADCPYRAIGKQQQYCGEDPGEPGGGAPRASFTVQCQWAACSFNGSGSTDPDNDIASYAWTYGDGRTGTGVTSTHSYPNAQRTYTAQLKVTDRAGNSNTASRQIQCWSFGSQAFCFAQ